MIIYVKDNIFWSSAEALTNPVNCVGIMGKGLAADFRDRFPENHIQYKLACQANDLRIGHPFVHKEMRGLPKYIVNFPTKEHWRNNSKLEDIDTGLANLVKLIESYKIKSIAIPALGCGLGGLEWEDVKQLIEKNLSDLDVKVYVHPPESHVW